MYSREARTPVSSLYIPGHDYNMPHNMQYEPQEVLRHCPPNCPHRLWSENAAEENISNIASSNERIRYEMAAREFLDQCNVKPTQDAVDQLVQVFLPCLEIMCDPTHPWDPNGGTWRKSGILGAMTDAKKKWERFWERTWKHGKRHDDSGFDLINYIGFVMRSDPESGWGQWGPPGVPEEERLTAELDDQFGDLPHPLIPFPAILEDFRINKLRETFDRLPSGEYPPQFPDEPVIQGLPWPVQMEVAGDEVDPRAPSGNLDSCPSCKSYVRKDRGKIIKHGEYVSCRDGWHDKEIPSA